MPLKQLTLRQQRLVTAGLRGFFCAGLATLITACFSWTFVTSVATPGITTDSGQSNTL